MTDVTDHGQLMDQTYRYQRLIYDVTRRYYLLGRDHLINNIGAAPGDRILEVACGTGRNLQMIRRQYPDASLYGFDISQEMLTTARGKLGKDVTLAKGDACAFDPVNLFGVEKFDHIILSYSLSMIPDWEAAMHAAWSKLADGGTLHIVDFGQSGKLPAWFRRALMKWLKQFHVAPREELLSVLNDLGPGPVIAVEEKWRGYALYGQKRRLEGCCHVKLS